MSIHSLLTVFPVRIMNQSIAFFLIFYLSCIATSCDSFGSAESANNQKDIWEVHADSINLEKGKIFIDHAEFSSARVYLLKSAASNSIRIKTESYFHLNSLEVRLKNYDTALIYLQKYHENALLIYQQALESELKIQEQHLEVKNIQQQSSKKLLVAFLISTILLLLILRIIYLQRKKITIFSRHKRAELKKLDTLIESKKDEKKSVTYTAYLLQADIFMQTPIYKKIKQLENQNKTGNDILILTYEKQDHLQRELKRSFSNFINDLEKCGAKLTSNDIKLCCLSLLPLTALGKAVCFGACETNSIKQRKHYIKKKMTKESDNRSLFDFIFTSRT